MNGIVLCWATFICVVSGRNDSVIPNSSLVNPTERSEAKDRGTVHCLAQRKVGNIPFLEIAVGSRRCSTHRRKYPQELNPLLLCQNKFNH